MADILPEARCELASESIYLMANGEYTRSPNPTTVMLELILKAICSVGSFLTPDSGSVVPCSFENQRMCWLRRNAAVPTTLQSL